MKLTMVDAVWFTQCHTESPHTLRVTVTLKSFLWILLYCI